MKNTPETAEVTERQHGIAHQSDGMLANFRKSLTARITALLAVLTPVAAAGCGGETEKQAPPQEIPECQKPENLTAPVPCAEPGKYLWESNRLTVYFDVPGYNELCLNPLQVQVLGDTWQDKGNGTTDLNPMQPLEGVKWVYESDNNSKNPDDFITAEVPPGSDLSGFALWTRDVRGKECVSDTVATGTMPRR